MSTKSSSPKKTEGSEEEMQQLKETYGFKESFKTWKRASSLENTEYGVLSKLSIFPECDDPHIKAQIINTPIDYKVPGDEKFPNYIHEFYIENTNTGSNTSNMVGNGNKEVVMVHGYGAALGLFFKNFESMSQMPGIKLHCLDLLGFGLSSRPNFPKRGIYNTKKKRWYHSLFFASDNEDPQESVLGKKEPVYQIDGDYKIETTLKDVEVAENFFLESMEAWRKVKKIDSFTLIGHSLGGYLSCCYALKYPERVNKLVLISPVGVETSIFDLNELNKYAERTGVSKNIINIDSQMKPDHSTELGPDVAKEFETTDKLEKEKSNSSSSSGKSEEKNLKSSSYHVLNSQGHVEKLPNFPTVMKYMWAKDFSPFSGLRALGPWGPKMASGWSFRRFADLPDTESIMLMHEYVYSGFKMKGSGEHCLTKILGPGALAYNPLLRRAHLGLQCDSLWLYGDVDWMSKEAGSIMVDKINKLNTFGKKAEFQVVENAGHHVYLDNPKDFQSLISKFLDSPV